MDAADDTSRWKTRAIFMALPVQLHWPISYDSYLVRCKELAINQSFNNVLLPLGVNGIYRSQEE